MRIAATIILLVSLSLPALAHYEDAGDFYAATKGKEDYAKAHKPKDIWDLLMMSVTQPAFALSDYVHTYIQGSYRYFESNGIPDHPVGEFPNPQNPNTMSEQHYMFRMPAVGFLAGQTTALGMSPFGVAINGVPFDPSAAEWWDRDPSSGWQYEAKYLGLGLDINNGHVQPNGAYHYHGLPTGLLDRLRQYGRPALIGYAADGFPIYGPMGYTQAMDPASGLKELAPSFRVRGGTRPSGPGGAYDGAFTQDYEYVNGLGDLDDCNGRYGITPEYPKGTYYYVVTANFPYVPRGYKGSPDQSFRRRPRPGAPGLGRFGGMGPGMGPPPGMGPGMGPPGMGPPPDEPSDN